MALELGRNIAADRIDLEALCASIGNEGVHQLPGHAATADLGRHQRVLGRPDIAAHDPGQPSD